MQQQRQRDRCDQQKLHSLDLASHTLPSFVVYGRRRAQKFQILFIEAPGTLPEQRQAGQASAQWEAVVG